MRRARPSFAASNLPTVDDWAELSEVGWGTSWAVVGSSLLTMVEGSGADAAWIRQSDEAALHRQQAAERAYRRMVREQQQAAEREAERRERWAREQAAATRVNRLRELRYELEALKAKQTLREYRRTHPFGVECYGPVSTHGEPEWYPVNMRVASEADALAMAAHFTRIQGIPARAVAW